MSSTARESGETWLTPHAYDRLKSEMEQLVANRGEVAAEINARREEGDLKENGGYHAAREEQGRQEGRIRQLEDLLATAKVGDAPKHSGTVEAGTVVTVKFAGDDETEKFLIGSREIAATTDLEVYSPESAIGQAISGHAAGDTVSYQAPNGKTIEVEIVAVEAFRG